jgi:hypothetical protein
MADASVSCPYCNQTASLVTGETIYPHRSDLHEKRFYLCAPCDARVGCHPGTTRPLGRLANAELRAAKMQAHTYFDPLWKSGAMKRYDDYGWLAGQLGLQRSRCHIGMFDVETCKRVVKICRDRESRRGEMETGQ